MSLPSAGRRDRPGLAAARPGPRAGESAVVGGAAGALLFLAVAAMFLISAHLLFRWGVNYEETGGSGIAKVHPATWLASAAFVLGALRRGNPLAYLAETARRFPGLALFFATWLLAMIDAAVVRQVPLTPLVDSFALPMLLLPLIDDLSPAARRRLALMLHAVMTLNALLALYEFGTGYRLTPFVERGIAIADEWRSTALFGHPLINAAVTGAYALILAVGGGRDLPALLRPLLLGLQLAAMIAFGGRVATLALIPLLLWTAIAEAARLVRGKRLDLTYAALAALALPVVVGGVVALADAGFFAKFAARFVNDQGSAEARVIMLRLLQDTSWSDLILGADVDRTATFLYQEGIEFGIASFWVSFALLYGLGIGLFFFLGLFCFGREIWGSTRRGTGIVLALLLAVISTSLSISAKSTLLGMIVALLLSMLRTDAARGSAAPS